MVLWYRLPAKDSKFSTVSCSDWETINSTLDVKELGIKEDADFYHLFAYANNLTDVKFYDGGKNWTFEPQLIKFKVAKQDYTKYDKEEKKDLVVKQSTAEKFYCLCFQKLDFDKIYSGKIYFQNIPQIRMTVEGQLNEQMVDLTIDSMCNLVAVDNPELIKLEELQIPASGFKSGGGSRGQTELERLNERNSFLVKQLNLIFPDLVVENLADLYKHYNDEKVTVQVQQAVEIIKLVMGNG